MSSPVDDLMYGMYPLSRSVPSVLYMETATCTCIIKSINLLWISIGKVIPVCSPNAIVKQSILWGSELCTVLRYALGSYLVCSHGSSCCGGSADCSSGP